MNLTNRGQRDNWLSGVLDPQVYPSAAKTENSLGQTPSILFARRASDLRQEQVWLVDQGSDTAAQLPSHLHNQLLSVEAGQSRRPPASK
jgi:hypothetical protein